MANLTTAFRNRSERIHGEHQAMMEELVELERGLENLACYSEMRAAPGGSERVRRVAERLATQLPAHCHREETELLDEVADISPELAAFTWQMKQEHTELLVRLERFRRDVDELAASAGLEAAVGHLKEDGATLVRELRHHVAVEEHELAGFL